MLLPGCALFNRGLDQAADAFVGQALDYCKAPYHRRLALYTLLNGELEPHNIEVGILCPGDPES